MGRRLTVRTRRVAAVDVAALRVWIRGGERESPRPGCACLAGRMLDEGTRSRDWRRIAREAEDRGISIAAAGGYEVLALALDGPAAEVERMIDWAAELTLAPSFDPARWEWQRRLARAELQAMADEPEVLTGWGFLEQLYGDHPRGRPLLGAPSSLDRLSVEDSREFHGQALSRGVIAALAGAIDEEPAAMRIAAAFESAAEVAAAPAGEPGPSSPRERRRVVPLAGDQAHLFVGRTTVDRHHPELPALELAAVILGAGAGLAGRIPERVREREGLAYTIGVDTAAGASADLGRLVLYAATAPRQVERAERALREELARFVADGPEERELTEARAFLEGQEIFRRESARQWAQLLAEAELTGLPVDSPNWPAERWSAVSRAQLRAAAERWLDPDDLFVTVGLPEGVVSGTAS